MIKTWSSVPLAELLIERRETPSADDLLSGQVRIVEKISFNDGRIRFREGGETKTGMILVRPGDLVISGINAAKGAIAIYDESNVQPVAATIHYGAYTPNRSRVDINFLWWLLRSKYFRELLIKHVPGGIKTELKAKRLLPIPVPLPQLYEQRRISARIEEIAIALRKASRLHFQAMAEANALVTSRLNEIALATNVDGKIGNYLLSKPRNGWSARCDNAEDGIPVLSLSAVTGFNYRSSEFKRTSLHAPKDGHFWLNHGDLLITRSNTPELVGHAAIYDGRPSPCIYPDLMMRLDLNLNAIDPRFLWYWLQSPIVRDYIARNAKGTSPTMKKISQGIVMSIPFPQSFGLAEQKRVIAELDLLQTEVDALKRLQAESAAELDALLPAVLDRAFKGEL